MRTERLQTVFYALQCMTRRDYCKPKQLNRQSTIIFITPFEGLPENNAGVRYWTTIATFAQNRATINFLSKVTRISDRIAPRGGRR
jgi:hypothetical protein